MKSSQHLRSRSLACVVFALVIIFIFIHTPSVWKSDTLKLLPPKKAQPEVTIVVASRKKDNTTWLPLAFPEWDHRIYVIDDRNASLTVPRNKGREGMAYLTYIIDNYDSLPPMMVFQHGNRYQWHNDDPLYDGQRMLSRLRLSYVSEKGYVNLRCVWSLGCPNEILPFYGAGSFVPADDRDGYAIDENDMPAGAYYKSAFEYMFPGKQVPVAVGASCCAQFAVTNWKIRERPRSDYLRYRDWLMNTELQDQISGRILEYSWHIIFGKEAIHCPDVAHCYCAIYGLCNLACEDMGECHSQYTLPSYSKLPDGWPDYGWDGKWRDTTDM